MSFVHDLINSSESWIVASTLIFIALVFKPAKKAITGGLDARRASIVSELEEAHRLRVEAEALLADAKLRHQSAAKDAADIIAFAREESARMLTAAQADQKDHVARREKQALDRIAQAEANALSDIRIAAVDIALAASGDLLKQKLSGADGNRLIDEVIASIPSKVGAR